VVELAGEAGVALTPAGATFPYGVDPLDSNIRIAPSMPSQTEVEKAIEALTICIKLAAAERAETN
jgi:DNA-binding transcriptional MocR family regulator